MSAETKQEFPLIQWRRTHDGENAQEMVSVIRENGRSFACTADTREEAWAGLVRLMAQCMDAHAEQTGTDPGDALRPCTETEINELRRMGREEGCLAVPAHGAQRLDVADLTPQQWALNWRVWKDPAFAPCARFIEPGRV